MFDMPVDFVEVEKAWMNVVFTKRKPWSGWDKLCDKWNILSDKDNCEEKKSEVDAAQKNKM